MPDKPQTSRTPTIFDFQRNLDAVIHSGEREARTRTATARSELAARGLGISGAMIGELIKIADQVHADILKRAMELIHHFMGGGIHPSLADLSSPTRQRFESFAAFLLSAVPSAGRPEVAQKIRDQYTVVFQQRLDGALRDIEIGLVDGRRLDTPADAATTVKLREAMILRFTVWGIGVDLQKVWQWLKVRLSLPRR